MSPPAAALRSREEHMPELAEALRRFAGPNGSGESTVNGVTRRELLGTYVNADDIVVGPGA